MEFSFEYVIQIGDAKSDQIDCIASIEPDNFNGHDDPDWLVDGIRVNLARWGADGRVQHIDVDLPASHPMYPVLKQHVESQRQEVSALWSEHIANHIRSYSEAAE